MTEYLKTSAVHYCFSQELGEPRPKDCRCKKMVSREMAANLVKIGEADWLVDYSGKNPADTFHVVLRGRAGKTPRAHTIEKAHMERGLERMLDASDNGYQADLMHAAAEGVDEAIELWASYREIELESRCSLFRGCGGDLVALKAVSDNLGNHTGHVAHYVDLIILGRATELKAENAQDDPWQGRALFSSLGGDQRTQGGIGILLDN